MNRGDAESRVATLGAAKSDSGQKSRRGGDGASRVTAKRGQSHPETLQLMEAVVERENMKTAWLRVKGNKGAAGVDGMSVDALQPVVVVLSVEEYPKLKAKRQQGWRETLEKILQINARVQAHSGGTRLLTPPAEIIQESREERNAQLDSVR